MTQQSHLWVCTQKNRKQELAQILVHPGHGSITHDGWKQPERPSADEWIKRLWCIHTRALPRGRAKEGKLTFCNSTDGDDYTNGTSQSADDKCHVISLTRGI